MGLYIQILALVTLGVLLLWFGYTLLFGQPAEIRRDKAVLSRPDNPGRGVTGSPGDPQICPVCSARLNRGELVKSTAFPSLTGGKVRIMHIRGCIYCLEGDRPRRCPVCGASLQDHEILVARMFDRHYHRKHIHVLGCSRCRKAGTSPQ